RIAPGEQRDSHAALGEYGRTEPLMAALAGRSPVRTPARRDTGGCARRADVGSRFHGAKDGERCLRVYEHPRTCGLGHFGRHSLRAAMIRNVPFSLEILYGGGVGLSCRMDGELHAEDLHGLFV